MNVSVLTSKGQTTIPKEVREYLHLHAGDRIDFVIRPKGEVVLRPATLAVSELKGLLKRKNQKIVSLEEMDVAITQAVKERHRDRG